MSLALKAETPAAIEKRIDALLQQMTLQEKLGQISQSTSMQNPISEEIKRQIRAAPSSRSRSVSRPVGIVS
jgi:GTP1/Obg family GTP-binding protein